MQTLQLLTEVAPTAEEDEPAAQEIHVLTLVALVTDDQVPTLQRTHAVALVTDDQVPAPQPIHDNEDVAMAIEDQVPTGQFWQLLCVPAEAHVPAVQATHDPPVWRKYPAMQVVQNVALPKQPTHGD